MNDIKIILQAETFLNRKNILFVKPGEIGKVENNRVEVIFAVPEALDPNVAIVEPPDVRVWVNIDTGEVMLIEQM